MNLQPRPWLSRVEPYRPGGHALSPDGSMASNESPLGASPRVAVAVATAVVQAHRYPDPLATELRIELAAHHDVHPDQILVGNGSDELIYLMTTAFLAHGGHAVCADPPYRIDEISAMVANARVTRVPLLDWAHDLETMADIDADIAWIVNPHNPTGTTVSRDRIEAFVRDSRASLTVVDEAYIDFTDDPDAATAMPLARADRAMVLRTFSKVHGLAGLRVGYLVGDRDLLDVLRKIRAPFSVNRLSQAAAIAALEDPHHRERVRRHTRELRDAVAAAFRNAGHEVVDSEANFVLVVAPDEDGLVDQLAAGGVSVRAGSSLGVPGAVRVSVPSIAGVGLLTAALTAGVRDVPTNESTEGVEHVRS